MFKKITALFALMLVSCSVAFAAEYTLSNQYPPSHHISKGLVVFADEVAKLSGGKTTIKIADSAQLYKDTEIVDALQEGLVPLGLVATNKWGGMIPAMDVFDLPFLFVDLSSPKKFLDGGGDEILDREFQSKGVKNLFWADYGFIQMWNNKHPLHMPADFVGLTMRSFSAGDSETLKALGAAPTLMSSSEMYMGLQYGTVSGATTGMPAAVSRKIYEVTKYLTIANYTTAEFCVQANLEWWNTLDAETQDILLKAGKVGEAWIRDAIAESEAEAEKVVRDYGLEVNTLTEEERQAMMEATKNVKEDFLKRAGKPGQELVDLAAKVLN